MHTSRHVLEDQVEFAARLERVLELHEERVLRAHEAALTDCAIAANMNVNVNTCHANMAQSRAGEDEDEKSSRDWQVKMSSGRAGQRQRCAPLFSGGCRARSSCAARLCASAPATPS